MNVLQIIILFLLLSNLLYSENPYTYFELPNINETNQPYNIIQSQVNQILIQELMQKNLQQNNFNQTQNQPNKIFTAHVYGFDYQQNVNPQKLSQEEKMIQSFKRMIVATQSKQRTNPPPSIPKIPKTEFFFDRQKSNSELMNEEITEIQSTRIVQVQSRY